MAPRFPIYSNSWWILHQYQTYPTSQALSKGNRGLTVIHSSYAQELADEMRQERLTQADLARRHGMTRARVNQWLSLLTLPDVTRRRLLVMGDHWECRLLTERGLRRRAKEKRNL